LVGGTAVLTEEVSQTEEVSHKAMQSPDPTPHELNQSRRHTLTPTLIHLLLTASTVIRAQRVGRQPVRPQDVAATLLSCLLDTGACTWMPVQSAKCLAVAAAAEAALAARMLAGTLVLELWVEG
jgi:hypothetical protein